MPKKADKRCQRWQADSGQIKDKVLSIYLSIYRFCWHKWKNPYHIHLGYSIARLYQSINTKLHNDIA